MTKTRKTITVSIQSPKKLESAQARSERAIGNTIEAIENISLALENASRSIMFHIPADRAEPEEGLKLVAEAQQKLIRAIFLLSDNMRRPDD